MKTQYWYDVKKLMMKYGFSKFKAMTLAWKMKHAAEDLATFKNPENVSEILTHSIKGEMEAYKNIGIVLRGL